MSMTDREAMAEQHRNLQNISEIIYRLNDTARGAGFFEWPPQADSAQKKKLLFPRIGIITDGICNFAVRLARRTDVIGDEDKLWDMSANDILMMSSRVASHVGRLSGRRTVFYRAKDPEIRRMVEVAEKARGFDVNFIKADLSGHFRDIYSLIPDMNYNGELLAPRDDRVAPGYDNDEPEEEIGMDSGGNGPGYHITFEQNPAESPAMQALRERNRSPRRPRRLHTEWRNTREIRIEQYIPEDPTRAVEAVEHEPTAQERELLQALDNNTVSPFDVYSQLLNEETPRTDNTEGPNQ